MNATVLDGKSLAISLQKEIQEEITVLAQEDHRPPGLAVIIIGEDPASVMYVNRKQQACQAVGIYSECHRLKKNIDQKKLIALVNELNKKESIDGILIQLPLPSHLRISQILEQISPEKDVDGFHPYNMGRLATGNPIFRPCTPYGIMTLLSQTKRKLQGINAVIVGTSITVGRPMALELLMVNATVTLCHQYTHKLKQHVKEAELLIVAIGKTNVIQSEWLRKGCIVIDVGMNRLTDNRVVGDIEFSSAKEIASWVTPVPGGVGPMTIAMLLKNTLQSYYRKQHNKKAP